VGVIAVGVAAAVFWLCIRQKLFRHRANLQQDRQEAAVAKGQGWRNSATPENIKKMGIF
jgi:hypothetical protein